MSDASVYNLLITLVLGCLAAGGVLVTAAKEKERLWQRYDAMKQNAQYEEQLREHQSRQKRQVAQKANLAGDEATVVQPSKTSAA